MGSGPGVPVIFPSNGSVSRCPRPSTGSPGWVPLLPRYHGALRLLPARSDRLRSSLGGRYPRRLLGFVSPRGSAVGATPRPGPLITRRPPRHVPSGGRKSSQVPGVPLTARHVLRPRRAGSASTDLPAVLVAFRAQRRRGRSRSILSGFHIAVRCLAVYASPLGARLATGWPGLTLPCRTSTCWEPNHVSGAHGRLHPRGPSFLAHRCLISAGRQILPASAAGAASRAPASAQGQGGEGPPLAVILRPVAERNCVPARGGGEHPDANRQPVGTRTRFGRRDLASLRE